MCNINNKKINLTSFSQRFINSIYGKVHFWSAGFSISKQLNSEFEAGQVEHRKRDYAGGVGGGSKGHNPPPSKILKRSVQNGAFGGQSGDIIFISCAG